MKYQAVLAVIGAQSLILYFVGRTLSRMRSVAFHRYKIVEVAAVGLPRMPAGYTWRSLGPGDLASQVIDVDADVQAERFASGFECLGVFDRGDELIAVTWLARTHPEGDSLDIRFVLPADAAWDTGMWIREDRRMGRAFAAMWGAIGLWLVGQGLTRTISTIVDYNVHSIASHDRLGARPLGFVTFLRLGNLQYVHGARPRWRWRGGGTKPIVRLD